MSAPGYAVPPVLRGARFVPRQQPGRREPMRVTAGAFAAAGLPVPEDRRQWNAYQLSGRQGWDWTPDLDQHIGRRGGEILPGPFITVDLDAQLAVDGSVWLDGLRWLTDAGARAGHLLDIGECVAVRTPGHDGHGRGWHLWYCTDPGFRVRTGPLKRCGAVEVKARCTAPGSPGYTVRYAPGDLPVLPRWIAELAGAPRIPAPRPAAGSKSPAAVWNRLCGIVDWILRAEPGTRNKTLFDGARLAGEMVAAGQLDRAAAEAALFGAAERLGLAAEDGEGQVRATIRSGLDAAARSLMGGAA
jgi:hypothetical protein